MYTRENTLQRKQKRKKNLLEMKLKLIPIVTYKYTDNKFVELEKCARIELILNNPCDKSVPCCILLLFYIINS